MDESLRIKALNKIKKEAEPFMTGIRIAFEGETRSFDAYKIPLQYLVYNKYNGRIGSLVKSYEKQDHSLDPEKAEDIKMLEQFLYDSKKDRNDSTEISLVKDGQKQYGIVTHDGTIIDGNRRAFLLNKIHKNRDEWISKGHDVSHCEYFIAVILNVGATPKEISKLETTYQMGEESKLDYNPIEKYLKCKDLKNEFGFSVKEISEMMTEKKGKIEEWLEIMDLMDDYLGYLEYDGIYTRLDKREGQFVDLNRYLNRWKTGYKGSDWGYGESDIADLKWVCFDYIRAEYEGKEFRNIAQPSVAGSVFSKGNVWPTFLERHIEKIEAVKEKSIEQWVEENPGAELYKLLESRDVEWKKQVEKNLNGNLNRSHKSVEAANESNMPQKLLGDALELLRAINTDFESFYDPANEDILKQIHKIAFDHIKKIQRNT